MTLETDLERVAEVTARLRRHSATADAIGLHLSGLQARLALGVEVAPVVAVAHRLTVRLTVAAALLDGRAERAAAADLADLEVERRSFAGGTALCSVIQVASPIPARPSTSGLTGAIDNAGVARDVASLAVRPLTIAARTVPIAAIAAAIADLLACRLGVGSGAPISTRKIIDEHGEEVYEGSRSTHAFMHDVGLPLDPDLTIRDRQMWEIEHRNAAGFGTEPYPGYPAYEVNAPRR